MTDSVKVELKDLGVIDGLHTVEVIDTATGDVIGYNQSALEEGGI
jgi:hypothetical protein